LESVLREELLVAAPAQDRCATDEGTIELPGPFKASRAAQNTLLFRLDMLADVRNYIENATQLERSASEG
jgi:hypothetical protein